MQHFSIFAFGVGVCFLALSAALLHDAIVSSRTKTPAAILRRLLGRVVNDTMTSYDRHPIFGTAVPVILFLVLPGAAALNALLGGSTLLLSLYFFIAASILLHMLFAEKKHVAVFLSALSGAGAVLALVVIPYYTVWSLSGHIMHETPAQATLMGGLIGLVMYAGNAGLWTLSAVILGPRKHTCRLQGCFSALLLALPIAFVLYWLAILTASAVGISGISEYARNWQSLLLFISSAGGSFAVGKSLLDVTAKSGKWAFCGVSGGIGILFLVLARWASQM